MGHRPYEEYYQIVNSHDVGFIRSYKEAIRGGSPSQFVVAKGHNIWEVIVARKSVNPWPCTTICRIENLYLSHSKMQPSAAIILKFKDDKENKSLI